MSSKHLPSILLSHVSTKYMQGHHHLDKKAWGQGATITVKQRSEPMLKRPQSSDQQDGDGGGEVVKKVQLPTNCNRSPFIIVSDSLNNKLYL